MTTDWASVTLREVLDGVKRPVELQPAELYPTLGVRWYGNGAFAKAAAPGSSIAAKSLNQVSAGDIVYSKLFAWKGSFATVSAELEGTVASTEFPTYRAQAALLPEYFALWSSRPQVWAEAELACTGTTANSRNRLSTDDFLDLEMELPSAQEQELIVATIRSVRDAENAWLAEQQAALAVHSAARLRLIENDESERLPLSEFVTGVKGGKSPKCLDRPPRVGEFGVLKVSAIRDGVFRSEEAKALPPGAAPFAADVKAGDLLYSRANTTTLVGAMCRVHEDHPTLLLCDKTMRVAVDDKVIDPEYLVEAVGAPSAREHIELMAGGTSDSMKNISKDAFLETEVPVPPLAVQREISRKLRALRHSADIAAEEVARIRAVRLALTEDLVSGMHSPLRANL